MADISKIKIRLTTYNIKDGRIEDLPGSENTFLNGDGEFTVPSSPSPSTGAVLVDCGSFLQVNIPAS